MKLRMVEKQLLFGVCILLMVNMAFAVSPSQKQEMCVSPYVWQSVKQNQQRSTQDIMKSLAKSPVVLLGEFHDSVLHHDWELATLTALYNQSSSLAIGLEMLPGSAQPALDRWIRGETNEEIFLKESKWYEYWKFDAELYLPILRFARMNNIPLYGINVEQDLKKRVRAKGWQNISQEQRGGISDPAVPSDAYLEMLASTFALHGHGGSQAKDKKSTDLNELKKNSGFKRFVQGQQLWDRAMAQGIEALVKERPERQVVALMGSGHLMNGFGVPHQLKDLGVKDVKTLIPWEQSYDCEMLTPDLASAVYGMPAVPRSGFSGKQKLGVHIEPAEQGVKVSKVVDGSLAQVAGLEEGDILVELAGIKIKRVIEVIDVVRKMQAGTWLPIVFLRDDETISIVAKFPLLERVK